VSGNTLQGCSILVVDEDSLIIRRLMSALRAQGASVQMADCATASVLIERPNLAAVVLECAPPSRERAAIVQRLQARNVPLLFYTAQTYQSEFLARDVPTMIKPCSDFDLVEAVTRLTRAQG
jgi:DNA-binding response OmpR family regulator